MVTGLCLFQILSNPSAGRGHIERLYIMPRFTIRFLSCLEDLPVQLLYSRWPLRSAYWLELWLCWEYLSSFRYSITEVGVLIGKCVRHSRNIQQWLHQGGHGWIVCRHRILVVTAWDRWLICRGTSCIRRGSYWQRSAIADGGVTALYQERLTSQIWRDNHCGNS